MKSFFDRIFPLLFVLALISLGFVTGVIGAHYEWSISREIPELIKQTERNIANIGRPLTPPLTPVSMDDLMGQTTATDPKKASPGYVLIVPQYANVAYLINKIGHVVRRWELLPQQIWPERKPQDVGMGAAQVLPDGSLIAVYEQSNGKPSGYGIVRMDQHSKLVWASDKAAHHLPYFSTDDNRIYTLVHQMVNKPVPGLEGLPYPLVGENILKLSAGGKVIKEISILEAFSGTPFAPLLYNEAGGGLVDYLQADSIFVLPPDVIRKSSPFETGDLVVSLRALNIVAVIAQRTGKVIWAYNGLWHRPNSAKFTPGGNLMVLDNQGHVTNKRRLSRIVEIDPATLAVKWWYGGNKQPFFTFQYGDVQRLPNGNTFLSSSMERRLREISPEGAIVWQYSYKQSGMPPISAQHYPETYFTFEVEHKELDKPKPGATE